MDATQGSLWMGRSDLLLAIRGQRPRQAPPDLKMEPVSPAGAGSYRFPPL